VEPDKQFEIQLGHICNNRCVFCVSGQMTELRRAKPIPADPVRAELDKARAQGMSRVTFLGGEPTIQKSFLENLQYAVDLGFEEVVIFTNGVRFKNKDWLDHVTSMSKAISWRISLQGGNEEVHDFTTEKKGAFGKIVSGLETLSQMGQKISINMCVVEQNYRSLVDLPALVEKYGIWQVHLDMVRPRDSGERTEEYLDGIMPDYEDLARVLRVMLQGFHDYDPKFDVNIGNLPYCLIPEWAHRIHHDGNLTYTVAVSGESELSEPWDKYEDKRTDKVKLSSCESCAFESKCSGFFDLYGKKRGVASFRPLSLQALRKLDEDQNLFTLMMGPSVRALIENPPPGWEIILHSEDEFQRRFDLVAKPRSGGYLDFSLYPAAHESGGDGEHEAFSLQLKGYSLPDHIAFNAIAKIFGTLADESPGKTTAALNIERLRARRRTFGKGSVVPVKIQKRLHRLIQGSKVSDWNIVSTAPLLSQIGASARLQSASGEQASVFFIQSAQGRIQVSWDIPSNSDAHAVERMLRSVVETLRDRPRATA